MMLVANLTKYLIACFLGTCLLMGQICLLEPSDNINSHLAEYSHINATHHDNIDDEPHAHSHKHSEDGEEHEHSHEHSKVSQSEVKLVSQSLEVKNVSLIYESKLGIIEKNLISNPHPFGIFRPPIKA